MNSIANIGFILDGNRRWAKDKGIPAVMGHKAGFDTLEKCVTWVQKRGIPNMVVYAFSTENWNRSAEEVAYLMDLFRDIAKTKSKEFAKSGVALRFVGERDLLPKDLQDLMHKIEESNPTTPAITVWICISYGARAEIVSAIKELVRSESEVTEETIRNNFWTAEMPDPDIIVRTGGEMRLSNFLLWQVAYSELFFLKCYWPDFSEEALSGVIEEFKSRERRRGK